MPEDVVVAQAEAAKAAPVEAPKGDAPAVADAPKEAPKETRAYTQEDLDRITAKVKKNERYRTRKEVEAFYQGRESAAPKPAEPAKPAVDADKPPTRDQFDSYEAFLDAKAEYAGKRAAHEYRVKAETEAKAAAQARATEERIQNFRAKVNEKYPDIGERAEAIAEIAMPEGMSDALAESELGPEILNHFVDNPKDFERIAALPPSAAIREIGKLEARLEGAAPKPTPVAEVKKPSAAPQPLNPVGGSAVLGDGEPSHDKPDEWRKWRDRQIAKRRAGSKA